MKVTEGIPDPKNESNSRQGATPRTLFPVAPVSLPSETGTVFFAVPGGNMKAQDRKIMIDRLTKRSAERIAELSRQEQFHFDALKRLHPAVDIALYLVAHHVSDDEWFYFCLDLAKTGGEQ